MHKNPLAWTVKAAQLFVVKPDGERELICDFAQEPLCLVSNSTGTPEGGVEAEVVVMHSGIRDAEYAGVDVQGKIIFTDAPTFHIDAPARAHGAIGILTVLQGHRHEPGLWSLSFDRGKDGGSTS